MAMNRSEFEVLELQVQQGDLPLKLYLYQAGVSYSTYHYRRKKCPAGKGCARQALAPISFKRVAADSSFEEPFLHGVALLFPNGLRAHSGSGPEELLMEVPDQSIRNGHVQSERYNALLPVSRQDGHAQGHRFAVRSGA